MKLHEIASTPDFHTFTNQLRTECSDYIAQMKAMLFDGLQETLLRGMRTTQSFGVLPIRTDREPLDTPDFISRLYDFLAEKQLGVANLRRRVIFTTGRYKEAQGYEGQVNFVFPVNGSVYFYEPDVNDSITTTKEIQQALYQVANQPEWRGRFDFTNTQMLIFLLTTASPDIQQRFMQSFYKAYPRLLKIYKLSGPQGLPEHIAGGEEIMVGGAMEYYHINCDYLQNYMNAKSPRLAIAVYAKILETGDWITLDSDVLSDVP